MPSLISLRRTDREKRDMADPSPKPEEMDDYPWGLDLNLGHEEIQKLGLAEGLEAGTEVALIATATVTNSSVAIVNSMNKRNMTLQIRAMQVKPIVPEVNEAELIYGGKVAAS